jgi:hypothetical protein
VSCDWSCSQPLGITIASSSAGIISSEALIVVHRRPPNLAIANVYGIRKPDPIRFGIAVSQNCSGSDRVIPTLPRLITITVHSTQIEKPRCSAKIEKIRFLRAICLPRLSQNCSFSGSQLSIHT